MTGPLVTAEKLQAFAPAASPSLAPYLTAAATMNGITTPLRLAHWMAQAAHESANFTRREEGLSYSAERLMVVWPSRFPTMAAAAPFAHNSEKLADFVYGGRMGNTQPGDGFAFAGKGFIQITGRDAYRQIGALCGLDLEHQPELAITDAGAAETAAAFWTWRHLNDPADRDDITAVTRGVNGGLNGLAERIALLNKAKTIFV